MRRPEKYIPIVAMLLLHLILYTSMASFALRRQQVESLGSAMVPFLVCMCLAAWLFPLAVRRFREAREGKPSRSGRLRLIPLPLMLCAFFLTLVPGYQYWLHNVPLRHVINFALALQVPAAYHLFYNFVPPRRRGVWFGAGMAAGFLWWRLLMLAALQTPDQPSASAHPGVYVVYAAQFVLALTQLAVLVYGMTLSPPEPPANSRYFAGIEERERRRTILLLFTASGFVYVMNAFVDMRMFPVLTNRTAPLFEPLQLLAALICPLVGWLLDRNPAEAFKRMTMACALIFVLAPSLVALDSTPLLYRVVHAVAAGGQFAVLVIFTTTLAGLSPPGDAVSRLPTLFYIWRSVSVFGFLLMRLFLNLPTGAADLVATLFAVGYYILINRAFPPSAPQTPAADGAAVADPSPAAMPVPPPRAGFDFSSADLARIFEQGGLSPRECEVAALMLRGAKTREMAEELTISENTVKVHVSKVLAKFSVPSRYAFLMKVLSVKGENGSRH